MDKAIVPQIRRLEGSLTEWNKFSALLLSDSINYMDLQLFVDSLPVWGDTSSGNMLGLAKKSSADNSDNNIFNPSRTFGGEKNKFNVMGLV